jgi:Flp pilus assembly protein TadD
VARVGKACAVFVLAVLAVAGGWEGIRYATLRLALAHAHREFSQGDYLRAEFWTGRAFAADQKNVEAMRLMAEIDEVRENPSALGWRIQVARREPGNTEDIMAWAKCALRFGQTEMAADVLNTLPADFKNRNAEYHELMAGCALAGHETGLAEAYFVQAAELGQDNPVNRVNLVAFRLANASSPEVRAAAARELEGDLADSRVSLFAARALLGDAVRNRDRARAHRFAEKLRSLPQHNLTDDLTCLEAVMGEPAFRPALEAIEHRAASDARWVTETGAWLNTHGMAAETLRWFAQLPQPVQSNLRVQMTASESYLAMSDWKGLKTYLGNFYWDDCEFLRTAMLIRCQRELSEPWEGDWGHLVTSVEANPPDDLLLSQLVAGWQWRTETAELLWEAAARPQTESKALEYLWDFYSKTNETIELLRVAKAQLTLNPSNPSMKNNCAFLSLLLFGASEDSERLAQEASTTNPGIPEWAATYAYALHLDGKEPEAKRVMEKLSPEALGRPGIALYYAIVLAANGDYAKARESLVKLNPAGMLPEEQKLAADLAQQLNLASR